MAKDFLFEAASTPGLQLGENFAHTPEQGAYYQISNSNNSLAEHYAPEINFYLNCTQDNKEQQVTALQQLYAGKGAALEAMQTVELSTTIGRRVLILGEDSDLQAALTAAKFEVVSHRADELEHLEGHRGNFHFNINQETQSVDHLIWNCQPAPRRIVDGMLLPAEPTALLQQLEAKSGPQKYHNYIRYTDSLCANSPKSANNCTLCLESCANECLSQHKDGIHTNNFSCQNCGLCVAACPSGALEYTTLPRHALPLLGQKCRGKNLLLIDSKVAHEQTKSLPANCLPIIFESLDFLDESSLLSLLYSCGKSCALWGHITPLQQGAVSLINKLSKASYGEEILQLIDGDSCCDELSFTEIELPTPFANADLFGVRKREIFSLALAHSLPQQPVTVNSAPIHYGDIEINRELCTLCLGCAEVCHTGALSVHPEDNTLRCSAALCAQCGNCQEICPESALQLIPDTILFGSDYCRDTVRAQDELYPCELCGTPFAPRRTIERVKKQMTPIFAGNQLKLQSLSCCPDCKAKLMLESLTADQVLSQKRN